MRNIALSLCYEGTAYHGWQVQKNAVTVAGTLDGTAKGGIVIAVADTLQIPVKLIGVGEQIDDLMPFQPADFVQALL